MTDRFVGYHTTRSTPGLRAGEKVMVTPQTPLPVIPTYGNGAPLVDKFGRIRVSSPQTTFNGFTLRDKNPTTWVEELTGGGTSTHQANKAAVRMEVSSDGDKVVRQSRVYIPYQAGKSDLFMFTANPGGQHIGVTKRAGRFDSNNGLFVQLDDDGLSFVVRSYVTGAAVDTKIAQADWNIDKLDGTGDSGITLDPTGTQIFFADFEWLGVGTVSFGFIVDGLLYYCHDQHHANTGMSAVYMSQATLPMRYELFQTGAGDGGWMEPICSTSIREGGEAEPGSAHSWQRDAVTAIGGGSPEQVIAIRNGSVGMWSKVTDVSCLSTTPGAEYKWFLVLNPTFTGGSAASWQSMNGSEVEYDTTRDGVWDGGGYVIASGLASTSSAGVFQRNITADTFALGYAADGTADVMALIINPTSNESFLGGLSWLEI